MPSNCTTGVLSLSAGARLAVMQYIEREGLQ
jgi:hypothetical protein